MTFRTFRPGLRAMLPLAIAATLAAGTAARADTIDDIIASQELRCGIQLDFPPAGYRNDQNEPEGFDVQYCKDLAAMLGVTAVVVETPSTERIPALVSNRIDVLVASTTPTVERAKTVAFSQPYDAFDAVVLTRKDAGITSFEDLKGRTVAGVTGTPYEGSMMAQIETWGEGEYLGFSAESETFLAVAQGKADAVVVIDAAAAALIASGQFPDFIVAGNAPMVTDYVSLATRKGDTEFLRWLNLAIWHQVKDGRFAELRETYIGGNVPDLSVPGVNF